AGKSTCTGSPVRSTSHSSCTKKYKAFKIQKGDSNCYYPFVLNDMAGLNACSRKTRQLHVKDVKRFVFQFNPERKLSKDDPHYNSSPSDSDKVHILVFVVDATPVLAVVKTSFKHTFFSRPIFMFCVSSEVPQIVLFTKVDEACPKISRDIRNTYKSVSLKEKVDYADTGINIDYIYPVKNIHSESDLKDGADVLILHALRRIIERGHDFLNKS
uniref:G domain-containing protein n=1 Tax=Haplochromis burtoni TaxID=8153 RepID=A0A3Q2WN76_HAPBU